MEEAIRCKGGEMALPGVTSRCCLSHSDTELTDPCVRYDEDPETVGAKNRRAPPCLTHYVQGGRRVRALSPWAG